MAEKQCQVCRSSKRAAVDSAMLEGMSIRAAAREFGFNRGSIFRHAKFCIRLRKTAIEEAKRRAEEKRARLSNDVDGLYEQACARLKKAEEDGADMRVILKAQAAVSKALALRSKFAPKPRDQATLTCDSVQPVKRFSSVVIFEDPAMACFPAPSAAEIANASIRYVIKFVTRQPTRFDRMFDPADEVARILAGAEPEKDLN
jgi:transposase